MGKVGLVQGVGWILVLLTIILRPAEGMFGSDKEYSIVIEAGSSETNLLVGVFEKKSGRRHLVKDELYETFKPGVSDLVDNVEGFKEHIEKVLKRAEKFIPSGKWDNTPVKFRAVGVFRLLEGEKRGLLLQEVNNVLKRHKFKTNEYTTSVLSDSDLGLFGWISANLLADRFYSSPDDMVATLDLIDHSAYITFPLTHAFYSQFPLQVRWITIAGERVTYFTRKYEGLGIDAATLGVLELGNPRDATSYFTPCISSSDNGKTYKGGTYLVYAKEGDDSENDNIKECTRLITTYIKSFLILRTFEPALTYKKYALSDFYLVLKDAGLLAASDEVITIDQIKAKSDKVCKTPGPHDNPFMCLHLIYIYTLLTEAYKFPSSTEITVANVVNNHHINWALGMAFYSLESGM